MDMSKGYERGRNEENYRKGRHEEEGSNTNWGKLCWFGLV
jgi:hypothetical protein